MEFISQPWPWYVAGPMITLVMFLLMYFGKKFGVSSNLRTACAAFGADKFSDYFKIDWKKDIWNWIFIAGAVLGGFISAQYLSNGNAIELAAGTVSKLEAMGFANPGENYLPHRMFGIEALTSVSGIMILLIGGFLVGFGARYAGGCTSGHAITGLSNLQIPSLIAVVGFFIGGLIMTHFLLPLIF